MLRPLCPSIFGRKTAGFWLVVKRAGGVCAADVNLQNEVTAGGFANSDRAQ